MSMSSGRLPTVLYVAGAGRSGSTLLERLIAEKNDFFAVGELYYLWERGYERNELCSCGEPFHDCPFWQEVLRLTFGPGPIPVAELRDHLAYLLRFRRIPAF